MEPTNKLELTQRLLQSHWQKMLPAQNTIKTYFLPVSRSFYDYLLEDGTFIHPKYTREYEGEEMQETKQSVELGPDDIDLEKLPQFEDIESMVKSCMKEFNNEVFVKLGWKSPKDCTSWLPGMKCTHIEDIFMALKCSEYIAETLVDYEPFWWPQNQASAKKLNLSIKQYIPIEKSLEFRCFIRQDNIVIISQRNAECIYPHLIEKEQIYRQTISQFIQKHLKLALPIKNKEQRYVADLAIVGSRVLVIDINPWRQFTNPLMLTWQELEKAQESFMKIVKTKQDIVCEDLREYNIPAEFADDDKTQIVQLMQLMKKNPELFY